MLSGIKKALLVTLVLGIQCIDNVAFSQFYDGMQMDFGKNRIQYINRFWSQYKFERFDIYFYQGGKNLAIYTAKSAHKNIPVIEDYFDFSLDEKMQFIIYNKLSDFKQSNIGLPGDSQDNNIGGVTQLVGNKVFLYFNGDYTDLERQIKAGIAEVMIRQILYGGDWKDKVKSSTLLTLPEWYEKGLIAYISEGWSVATDNLTKDGVLSGKFRRLNRLRSEDASLAGYSIWAFIARNYGDAVIPNILYMTKISRSADSGFLFVVGLSLSSLTDEWIAYYTKKYTDDDAPTALPEQSPLFKKIKHGKVYNQFKISPDGKYAVYVTNEMGKYKIWLYDVEKKKRKKILRVGHKIDRINDYSFPLVDWHPSGELFSYIRETKGKIILTFYTLEGREKESREIFNFEKILDFKYSHDGRKMVFSAVQNGLTDIFVYTISSNTYEQITQDRYDDLTPSFINNSSQIMFTSNRDNDTLKTNEKEVTGRVNPYKDLYVYNYSTKSNVLRRVTDSPLTNELAPMEYDKRYFSYLADNNGIVNRYLGRVDSAISYIDTSEHFRYFTNSVPITNYPRGVVEHYISPKSGKYTEVLFYNGLYQLYLYDMPQASFKLQENTENTEYRRRLENQAIPTETKVNSALSIAIRELEAAADTSGKQDQAKEVDINDYKFEKEGEGEKPEPQTVVTKTPETTPKDSVKDFFLPKQRNYRIAYAKDFVVSQIDNSIINDSYQLYNGGPYVKPVSMVFKYGIIDLLENYKIFGGIRLGLNGNSKEYFLSYQNMLKRLDKQYILSRSDTKYSNETGTIQIKVQTHELKYILTWPFSELARVGGVLSVRSDRGVYLSVNRQSLETPNIHELWGTGKVFYVFDNTLNKGLNLYEGTRLRVFGEHYKQISKTEVGDLSIVGFDVRNYISIHRELIWANRIAASTSFGSKKLIYYLGSVDRWLVLSGDKQIFDFSNNPDPTQEYQYQALATNMRGFIQNARNGNSFAVINSEIRFPIFRYLIRRPIRSDFISNFQIITFADIGSAWTGKSPYSEENSSNQVIIEKPPLTITLNNYKEPIIGGYGFGLRSRLFSYFIRVDWAWGVENKVVLPRVFYLSMGLDF